MESSLTEPSFLTSKGVSSTLEEHAFQMKDFLDPCLTHDGFLLNSIIQSPSERSRLLESIGHDCTLAQYVAHLATGALDDVQKALLQQSTSLHDTFGFKGDSFALAQRQHAVAALLEDARVQNFLRACKKDTACSVQTC